MICGLFSVFDPVCVVPLFGEFGIKWYSSFPLWVFVFWQIGTIPSGIDLIRKKVSEFILKFVSSSSPKLTVMGFFFISTFISVVSVNLSGLTPMSFPQSSHPGWVFPMGMVLFVAGMLRGLTKGWEFFSSHFLPTGTPPVLWAFLVLVETVSYMIRPLTLSVRLVANIMAGHLFVEMLSLLSSKSSLIFVPCVISSVGLDMFEFAICIVQAYVFTMLSILYWSESE